MWRGRQRCSFKTGQKKTYVTFFFFFKDAVSLLYVLRVLNDNVFVSELMRNWSKRTIRSEGEEKFCENQEWMKY